MLQQNPGIVAALDLSDDPRTELAFERIIGRDQRPGLVQGRVTDPREAGRRGVVCPHAELLGQGTRVELHAVLQVFEQSRNGFLGPQLTEQPDRQFLRGVFSPRRLVSGCFDDFDQSPNRPPAVLEDRTVSGKPGAQKPIAKLLT